MGDPELQDPEASAETTPALEASAIVLSPYVDAIITMDAAGAIVDVNRAAERLFGYQRADVVGRPLAPAFIRAENHRGLAAFLETGEGPILGRRVQVTAWHADGSELPVELTVAEVELDGRRLFVGFVHDERERKAAEEVNRRTTSLLQATLDSTADGILVVDTDGKIAAFNRRFAEMWRIPQEVVDSRDDDRAIGFVLDQLSDPDAFLAKVRELYSHPHAESFDVLAFKDGRVFERYSAPQVLDDEPVGRVWSFRDVTQRERTERELREAEGKYRDLVERIPAVVYHAIYGEGAPWLYISPQVESMLGFTPDEWVNDPSLWLRRLHPEDRDRVMEEENLSRDTGRPFVSEYRFVAKDGSVVWVRDEAEAVLDEHVWPVALRGLWYDITQQKEVEVAIRSSKELVRRLFERLLDAQEEERARIAGDIHDDSIQVVTAVGLRLQTLRRGLTDPAAIEQVEKLQATVEAAIARLRHLLFDLRPRALDAEGLPAALRLYLDQLQEQADIETVLENRLVEEPAPEVRTTLYRIAQESLVNARRHANATKIEVLLEAREGGFYVRVRDDGVGFDGQDPDRSEPGHLGLSSMRERAEMARGWLRVDSTPGRGTTVEFWLPAPR